MLGSYPHSKVDPPAAEAFEDVIAVLLRWPNNWINIRRAQNHYEGGTGLEELRRLPVKVTGPTCRGVDTDGQTWKCASIEH